MLCEGMVLTPIASIIGTDNREYKSELVTHTYNVLGKPPLLAEYTIYWLADTEYSEYGELWECITKPVPSFSRECEDVKMVTISVGAATMVSRMEELGFDELLEMIAVQ